MSGDVPTLTNGGLILLLLAVTAAAVILYFVRKSDNVFGRRCERCNDRLHPRTPARMRYCSEYCRQSCYRKLR